MTTEVPERELDNLWDDGEFVLSRVKRSRDRPPALFVRAAAAHPADATIARLEHAHSLRGDLASSWAARPTDLVGPRQRLALRLEDPGGEVLARLLGTPWDIPSFLRVAAGVASALSGLHGRGLVHKDVKPSNLLVDLATGKAWLTGFGIASRLRRERQSPEPPEIIAGTLAYMAPEQTGRMNRSIDSRSDLYAFGLLLYQMLVGELPFTTLDPMELVHCHVARRPVPPHERSAHIPRTVSALVMKLLAKVAEDRYQTASGVEADLRLCVTEWQRHGDEWQKHAETHGFPLGTRDASDRFLIPEKLYGREREIEQLLSAFDRVVASGRPGLMLVSGYSGVGKSSVVSELHKALLPPRGLFASGKFDQHKRDTPYATLAQAFQRLVGMILVETEAEFARYREAILAAVGPYGQLIINLIPELERVIGKQPPIAELAPQDAQRVFEQALRRFIGVFARPEHPLALFLDDLQWLDLATLDALQHLLLQEEVKSLFVVGAYRDNEVGPEHPLLRRLDAIRAAGVPVSEIQLAPLALSDVCALITDTLHDDDVLPLAELVHDKTAGNPFFATHFLTALADDHLIAFELGTRRWIWDRSRIATRGFTDNVVALMSEKITRLAAPCREAMQAMACIGNTARVDAVAAALDVSVPDVHAAARDAVDAGLVALQRGAYAFLHDRIQEASYALIAEAERASVHLGVGRRLLARTPPEKLDEHVFEIVNQLNRGIELVRDRDELDRIAELNAKAGRRAKAATSYVTALAFLRTGATVLDEAGWQRRRALAFTLAFERAECEFLMGDLKQAEARLSALVSRAEGPRELAAVACLRMMLYVTQGEPARSVEVCLEYLENEGIHFTPHPSREDVEGELDRMWRALGSRSIEDLARLPETTDPATLATLDVLAAVASPAWFTDQLLPALIGARIANISIERGNGPASSFGYSMLGMKLGPFSGDYRTAYCFGKLALELAERGGNPRTLARVLFGYTGFTRPWADDLTGCRELLERGFEAAERAGDVTYATYLLYHVEELMLIAGSPLEETEAACRRALSYARKLNFDFAVLQIQPQLSLTRMLRGNSVHFGSFDSPEFDQGDFERICSGVPALTSPLCRYWFRRQQAHFLAGDARGSVAAAEAAEPLVWCADVFPQFAEHHFYGALARAECLDSAEHAARPQLRERLEENVRRLAAFSENSPVTFGSRATLAAAELARVDERERETMDLYERAIRSARAAGFIHIEGLSLELAARFYAARGFETIASSHRRDARAAYLRWGAHGKVRQLEQRFPELRDRAPLSDTTTINAPVEELDLATVMKISQAVSGEIVLEKLVETLLRTAIEHAGAERGVLILPRDRELLIRAEANTTGNSVTVSLRETPVSAAKLPESVVRYAARTQDSVILDDAVERNPFSSDEYITAQRARSVLCVPLVKQAALVALLYLENNLAPNVFTPARVAILQLLASEAAMSLDNSRLYQELQQRETQIRQDERELRELIDAIPFTVVVLGAQGQTLDANAFALDYWGLSIQEVRADVARVRRFHPDDIARLEEQRRQALSRGEPFEIEQRSRRKDGQYRWFLIRYNPVRNDNGDIVRWYATATDIDDLKSAEERIRNENLALREEVDRSSMFEEIVGSSAPLRAVLSHVSKVAPTDSTVLITGETGTGKELIARAVHKRSPRSPRAFVSVNCAAIPASLIASELFGHERGAFTGALQRRQGRFELADGGTLFLDEVGELPVDTQIMLLRVLQEREFERVGGGGPVRVNVRVIAATNRDLQAAVADGIFRADLFYRLNVFPLDVPALRDRRADIPLLVEYFMHRFCRRVGKKIRGVGKDTSALLQAYDWPGNIRELQNVIERAVIIADSDTLAIDERWLGTRPPKPSALALPAATTLAAHEKSAIEAALMESKGRVAGPFGAAARLGVPSSTLESKIKALKIDKRHFKST
jgi:PAS domain S-box-containing protein